jgi:hypothetical protein
MLSRFAIGLAMLLDASPIWSIEIPYYFPTLKEVRCYQYEHMQIDSIKIRRTNDANIHIVYFKSKELYVSVPYDYGGELSLSLTSVSKKCRNKLRMLLISDDIIGKFDGQKICLKPRHMQGN